MRRPVVFANAGVVVSRPSSQNPPNDLPTGGFAEQPTPAATAADEMAASAASTVSGNGNPADPADPAAAGLKRLRLAATVLGPLTIVTALLYYYGYVTTYAEYAYFGVNVDLLGYSSADFVLRSPASLFAPLLALLVIIGLGYWAHMSLARRDLKATHPRRASAVFWVAIAGGAALLFRAALGIVDGNLSAHELIGTTPAALGLGALLVLYSFRFRTARQTVLRPADSAISISTVAWILGWCFVIASLFWLVNSFASAYGRGLGQDVQQRLVDQPEVILHTQSRLVVEVEGLNPAGILCESAIDSKDYPYRYVNLRLLATSGDSYFLVPVTWSESRGIVIIVPKSGVSLQLMDWPGVQQCDT
jgi:hypothetical protein